jgi:hypothetical protein
MYIEVKMHITNMECEIIGFSGLLVVKPVKATISVVFLTKTFTYSTNQTSNLHGSVHIVTKDAYQNQVRAKLYFG